MSEIQFYSQINKLNEYIYYIDGEWYDSPLKRRMTILKLENGNLIIHNAIRLKDEDYAKINDLGNVDAIVVPNTIHCSEAKYFVEKYPNAKVYLPNKLFISKKNRFHNSINLNSSWPYDHEIKKVTFKNNLVDESVFIHVKAKTLVVTDMLFNMKSEAFKNKFELFIFKYINDMLDKAVPSRLIKYFAQRDKKTLKQNLSEINQFNFNSVIMNHGDVILQNGKQIFNNGYRYRYGENII